MLKAGYSAGAVFAMSNSTLFNRVMAVTDTTGKPIFTNPTTGGVGYMLGHAAVVDDYIPDDTILFGNFQYYGLNLSQDIMLEVSRESSFNLGLIDYRAMYALIETIMRKPIHLMNIPLFGFFVHKEKRCARQVGCNGQIGPANNMLIYFLCPEN